MPIMGMILCGDHNINEALKGNCSTVEHRTFFLNAASVRTAGWGRTVVASLREEQDVDYNPEY